MAYENNANEEVISVVQITDFTEYRVTKITSENGEVAFDVRQWYSTQKEPEKRPTQKGVRLRCSNLVDILASILSSADDSIISEIASKSGIEMRR